MRVLFLGVELLDGKRLPGQARLDDEQVLAGNDPQVGGDHVAGRQLDHVARDELGKRDFPRLPVADHGGGDADHRLELGGGIVGPGLLHEPQRHAQHDHPQHDDGRPSVAGGVRDRRQHQKQNDQRIGAGLGQEDEPAVPLFLGDHVRAVPFQALGRLVFREPGLARLELGEDRGGLGRRCLRQRGRDADRGRRPPQDRQDVLRQDGSRENPHRLHPFRYSRRMNRSTSGQFTARRFSASH